jgi:hypothetical protein
VKTVWALPRFCGQFSAGIKPIINKCRTIHLCPQATATRCFAAALLLTPCTAATRKTLRPASEPRSHSRHEELLHSSPAGKVRPHVVAGKRRIDKYLKLCIKWRKLGGLPGNALLNLLLDSPQERSHWLRALACLERYLP